MSSIKAKYSIQEHIKKIKAADKTDRTDRDRIVFWGTSQDKSFLPHLKACVGSTLVMLRLDTITTVSQVQLYCKTKHITKVISTSIPLLKKLLDWTNSRSSPSLSNYAGSYFTLPPLDKDGDEIEVVFINPLKHIATVPQGRFMATRLITKLTKQDTWFKPTAYRGFTLLTEDNYSSFLATFDSAFLISIDIETIKEGATIRCVGYTAFFYDSKEECGMRSESVVLALNTPFMLSVMRKFNSTKPPKVFQNGKYDISYMTRYGAPVYNYLYDTANFFHSWLSELPKDLGFLNSFFIRKAVYWKDLAKTNDLHEYYNYNALDTWGTGNTFLAMLLEAPEFAINNYLLEFPLVFPCHLCEMTGIERDMDALEAARKIQQDIIDKETASLNTILGIPEGESFNTNSPLQMKALLKILGCSDLKKADEKALKKAKFRHPLNSDILGKVITIRKARKLVSTYLTPGKEFSNQNGEGNRILFALNPHATDTSRLASREHHFWCGLQVQNIPRGKSVKCTLKADPGFNFAEVDLEQAESRDTAYISGDLKLIHNVEFSPDFHCANASAFFGIPFEELYDVATNKKLNVPIRDIAKNVNHGANYNMGAYVLVDTMGEENILKAKRLLGLPRQWNFLQVAEHLLAQFHATYPSIREVYYEGVKVEIAKSRRLTSKAVHGVFSAEEYAGALEKNPGWVRSCFSDPSKSKTALNSYIAHPPQSLNAQTLNKAFLPVFKDIAMNPEHRFNFKLLAQIHDSILFQWRDGHRYLCDMVKERMEIPVTIKAYDNKIRTFTVPAGIKSGEHTLNKVAKYWSETE